VALTIGDALLRLGVNSDALKRGLQNSEKDTESWVSRVGGAAVKGLAIIGAAAVTAIGAAGTAAVKLAFDAMPLEGIRDAFQGITGDAGETMAALRAGSLGMVKDADLMQQYNLAASLVGKTFADELPDAMGYLSKVAAATGQDMGYMMDSLVRGVGRLSPMILDNLAIQVDLTSANEAYAASLGISVDEMTKAEQQAALMAQVMTKLAENTAAMPEVTGTATQQWAALQTTLKNTKDEIGLALLPVLQTVLGVVGDLAKQFLPKLVDFIKGPVITTVTKVADAFGGVSGAFAWAREEGKTLLESALVGLAEFLDTFLPEAVMDRVWAFIESLAAWRQLAEEKVLPVLQQIWEWLQEKIPQAIEVITEYWTTTLQPAFEQIWAFIQENLEPILAGLAAVIGTVLIVALVLWAQTMITVTIPAIIATVTALGPIILILAAIGLAVGLLVKAWQEDWGGIRTVLTEFWEEKAKPIFELIVYWFKEELPVALAALRDWFVTAWEKITTTVTTAWEFLVNLFENLKLWFTVTMPGALRDAWEGIKATLEAALEAVSQRISDALTWVSDLWQSVWDSISGFFRTTWDNLKLLLVTALVLFFDIFGLKLEDILGAWRRTWDSVSVWLFATWETIKSTVNTAATAVYDFLAEQLALIQGGWSLIWDAVSTKVSEIWESIKTVVGGAAAAIWGFVEDRLIEISGAWTLVWDAVSTKASEIWETIKTTVGDSINAVWTALTGKAEDIKGAITQPLADAWQALKDMVGRWLSLGGDLIQGLIDGAKAKAGALIGSITGPISDAIGRAKAMLGIGSPSKLFAEIGGSMMAGMAQGILQMAALPAGAMTQATGTVIHRAGDIYNIQREAYPGLAESALQDDIRFLRFAGAGVGA